MKVELMQAMPASGRREALETLKLSADRARSRGADLVVTPEMYLTGYNIGRQRAEEAAEAPGGETEGALGEIAAQSGISILAGLPERTPDGRIFNSAVLVDTAGQEVSRARKTHLFGEADHEMFSAGDEIGPVVQHLGWKIAIGICYDIEFPEFARSQALAGAEILLCPTANMLPFIGVAERMVPTRAEENAIFVAYANYVGREGAFDYCGRSCITGPDGVDLARAGAAGAEMLPATITREAFESTRRTSRYFEDRRTDLYRM